jgi:hypothetical protein
MISASGKHSVRTGYYAGPATYTLVFVYDDSITFGILMHCPCKAGIDTPGFGTMLAQNGKRNIAIGLRTNAWHRRRILSFKSFDKVFCLRMLYRAIKLAETTINTEVLIDLYFLHSCINQQYRLQTTNGTIS